MASGGWIAPFLLLAMVGTAGDAQTPPTDAPCELHVWPSEGLSLVRQTAMDNLNTSYLGAFGSSALARAGQDKTPVHTAPAATTGPLSTATQVALLSAAPLPALLGVPTYRVILHETPIDGRTLRTVKARYASSLVACYADLVVDDVVYSREYARGRNLKSFVRFRQFGSDTMPIRAFATWVQTKLLVFSLDPPVDDAPALAELDAAYSGNIDVFARLLAQR